MIRVKDYCVQLTKIASSQIDYQVIGGNREMDQSCTRRHKCQI